MTKAQEHSLWRIRRMVENQLYSGQEIKKWEVRENAYFITLWVVVGHKEDEGTLAEYLCRDSAQIYVGKRGGMTYPVYGKRGGMYTKTFHCYSILEASLKQR